MSRLWWCVCLVSISISILGCDPGTRVPGRDSGSGDATIGDLTDSDGDSIADRHEGADVRRDTDGDGTPDFEDSDSDGDGIPDSVEAGDDNPATPPRDADGDGTPDFIDLDADDNGIPDAEETDGDVDGDLTPDFADTDDDGDGISDAQEIRNFGRTTDSDTDGAVDYQDPDSDNDTILDGHERDSDTDGDGLLDVVDLDSDDDGLPDMREAGDGDLSTVPVDSDGDTIPDFRDPDSDNDGLSDTDEVVTHMTDPTLADSDMDGVSDLIEVGAGTDPLDMTDDPRARGDFVFVVPYMEAPDPERDTLEFRTSIQFADVYFMFDASGSMDDEIAALKAAVVSLIRDQTCADSGTACTATSDCASGQLCSPFTSTCIEDPVASTCVPSLWSGAGYYVGSDVLRNTLSLQPDPSVTEATGLAFGTCCSAEPLFLAIQAVAEPAGISGVNGCTGPAGTTIGCPGYRGEAVRILVAVTDENDDGAGTVEAASAALVRQDITLIGVWSGTPGASARGDLLGAVQQSGSFRADGTTPLFYEADGSDPTGFVAELGTAINEIVYGVPLRVTIDAADEPDDAGDALQFIERLETNTTGPGCTALATEDANPAGDGVQDTYPAVTPGSPVCWDVVPRMNETVPPMLIPQVFKARLTVSGDGSPLDSRIVYFLVPPEIPDPGGPD